MAETKEPEESTLPSKRKSAPNSKDGEEQPNKAPKVENFQHSEKMTKELENKDSELDVGENKNGDDEVSNGGEEDDNDGHDVERNGGAAVVDRKGKGILIEEEEEEDDEDDEDDDDDDDDSDDDSSDDGVPSDGDSDLSDDPLAEVDLDNILPSRTRRRVIQPGEFVANNPDDDSDSDDSDA